MGGLFSFRDKRAIMTKYRFVFACLGIALGLATATPSHAQNYHSYVSGVGTGTACTLAAPCADFTTAIAVTNPRGVISCVDGVTTTTLSSLSITKTITIDCAGTSATQSNIVINGANIVVTLRNLTINGFGTNTNPGIDFQNGEALFVEHCAIEHWGAGNGVAINFAPSTALAKLNVTDTVIKNNGTGTVGGGIIVNPASGGSTRVLIERTQLERNTYGIVASGASGPSLIEVRNSNIADVGMDGIFAYTSGGPIVSVVLDHSSATFISGNGVHASGSGAYVSLNDSTVAWSATGLNAENGGLILSYKNNLIAGNPSPGTAPIQFDLK
jgi:hypothetical protein